MKKIKQPEEIKGLAILNLYGSILNFRNIFLVIRSWVIQYIKSIYIKSMDCGEVRREGWNGNWGFADGNYFI